MTFGASGYTAGKFIPTSSKPDPAPQTQASPTIEQVRQLSALVTTKVEVADVQETEIKGVTGGVKAAILVKGDLLLTIDLEQARFESVDTHAKAAVLILPQPKVMSPRLDHEKTRVFGLSESGLWVLVPGDAADVALLNQAYREAQEVVAGVGHDPKLVQQAKSQAESVLASYFEAIGWRMKILWVDR
jgi:hypothetical protein